MNKQVPDILSDQAQSHLNRTILKLAWPAILEQFLICMASLADTAMVGSIGASATAAVAVNISSIWLINGFITSLSVGFSYLISHAVGSGDDARSRRITAQGLVCAAFAGSWRGAHLPSAPHLAWCCSGGHSPGTALHANHRLRPHGPDTLGSTLRNFPFCRKHADPAGCQSDL